MTPARQKFLDDLLLRFAVDAEAKFRRGQAEHGGNVWDRPALPEIHHEIIDLAVYLAAQRHRLSLLRQHLIRCLLLQTTDPDGAETHLELAIGMLDAELGQSQ